eukprot:scaffold587_cov109-Isochrysis_galbana.AAC.5
MSRSSPLGLVADGSGRTPTVGVPRVVSCLLSVHVCLPRKRGRVEGEPHASNAGACLARVSSACFHESARLMTGGKRRGGRSVEF